MSAIIAPTTRLDGKVALITGGSSGIGLATALHLQQLGAKVLVADRSPPPASAKGLAYHQVDVTYYAQLLASWESCKKQLGAYPSLVFVNAGISEKGKVFGAEDGEDIITKEPGYATLAVDLKAVANTVRIAWWGIKKEKVQGSIVVTASMAGYAGQAGLPIYNAAKHGCVGLVRSLRYLGPSQGIAISLVAPAITTTPLLVSPLPYAKEATSSPSADGRGSSLTSLSHMQDPDSVTTAFKAAGVPVNTAQDVASVVVGLFAEGKKANGKGLLVQGGKWADLEKGIAGSRGKWMGEEMAELYKGGAHSGVGIGTGTGKESKL